MNWLDFVLVFIFLLILFNGVRKGFMRQVVGLISFIIALYAALYWSSSMRGLMETYLKVDEVLANLTEEGTVPVWLVDVIINIIAFLLVFLVVSLLLALIARRFRFLKRLPLIGPSNAVLGGVLGAVKGLLVVFLVAAILSLIEIGMWERAVESSAVVALSRHYMALLFTYIMDLVVEHLGALV